MKPLQEAKNRLFDSAIAASMRDFHGTAQTADGVIGDVVKTEVLRGKITLNTGNEILVFQARHIADLDTVLDQKPGPLGKPVAPHQVLREPTAKI